MARINDSQKLYYCLISKRNLAIIYLLTYGSTRTEEGCIIGRRLIRVSHIYFNNADKKMVESMISQGLLEYVPDTKGIVATKLAKTFLDNILRSFKDIRPEVEKDAKELFDKGMEKVRYIRDSRRAERAKNKEAKE